MGSDRISVLRGKADGGLDWRVCRRGQSTPVAQGSLASRGEPAPEISGKRAGSVTIALPARQIVTRILRLPLLDPEELAGAVSLQVDKFSPFPVEQMVYSYEVLGKHGEEETIVLIAIAQRASVGAWGDSLRKSSTEIVRVDGSALGLWQAILSSGGINTRRRESLLVVDADEVVLITHDAGQLLAVSGLGATGDFGNSGVCEDLAEEVLRILMETDAENGIGDDASLVVVADGAVGQVGALKSALAQVLEIPVLDYKANVFPDVMDGILQRSIAFGADGSRLNLVPPDWVLDSDSVRFRKRLMLAGGSLIGLWVLLIGAGMGYLAWERSRLVQLRELETQWLRPANAVRSLRLQVSLIDRYQDRTHSALESLREISAVLPQGIDLVSLTYRKGDGIEVIGEADSGDLVLEFNRRLNASALFGDVRPGTRSVTQRRRHRFTFEIGFGEKEGGQ
jgi:hypothetical protein